MHFFFFLQESGKKTTTTQELIRKRYKNAISSLSKPTVIAFRPEENAAVAY